ncbi:phosphatidylinositol 3,4,5-trisphosphate 5-phosphatase 1 isoform X2 [Callorhinchus milii]|nr:phosphatidylinositol 3,4,5-trisphosphate 5-phosphatase 1 isoform X2 [Callorhinchus milii]|eukprot:gi/632934191/ref/XP_007902681.1/ PREDICTED: phosphatidylinositol 3,4,5-trisphosphate 5-phosphatase 1 isoform X1 [Callorhinchus milii]
MSDSWQHGTITRSRAEDLLSRAAEDGSFLVRASESISGAYALCVLYQNCVYTYRILPNEEKKLTVQASEGIKVKYFSKLTELIDYYMKQNMGLVTHLKHPVERDEEVDLEYEEIDPLEARVPIPPRNFPSPDVKEALSDSSPKHGSESTKPLLSDVLIQRFQQIDTSIVPREYMNDLENYLRIHVVTDAEAVRAGNTNLPQLKKLLCTICKGLSSELNRTMPMLESVQKLFDQQLSGRTRTQISNETSASLIIPKLMELTSCLSSIEDLVKHFLSDCSGSGGQRRRSEIPPVTFEVKSDGLGISTKIFLKVDVENGKMFIKKSKDGAEDKYYGQTKILQLIKSHKFHNRLVIVVGSEKEKTLRKEYVFADSKKREGFCQLLQQMKNKHSDHPEPDMITLFIGTWNMGDASPPSNIKAWFQSLGQGKTRDETAVYIPYDMYVVGTQEDQQGDKEWVEILKATLKDITSIDFKHVVTQTLWNIRIVIFAKPEHENRISHVSTNSVKTGIANALGNKGAVGVSLMFNGTSFGFVNSHLTSGAPKKLRRNQNYINILRLLTLGDKRLNPFDITNRFTHLFWLGDLNYRVDFPASEAENIIQKIKQQQYQELLVKDQLTLEKNDGKIFLQFQEEEINFAPSYRYDRDTRETYAYIKQKTTGIKFNLPSWCDRVLWKSYPMVHVMCQSYGCTNDIMTSDHSPVFATYEVGVTSQFVSKNGPNNGDSQGKIEFLNCEAKLKTKSKTKFFIEFYSTCLESVVKSGEGENQESKAGNLNVIWGSLPQLTPIISDPEYLLDQHILICIKSTDSYESYGEGCIALRGESHSPEVAFNTFLTHQGEETGEFQGSYKLTTSEGKQRERTYDFIKLEKDEMISMKHTKVNNNIELSKCVDRSARVATRNAPQIMAEEAAARARERVSSPCPLDTPSKDPLRLPQFMPCLSSGINNPNYIPVGMARQPLPVTPAGVKQVPSPDQKPSMWAFDVPPKQNPSIAGRTDSSLTSSNYSPLSPKKVNQMSPNRVLASKPQEPSFQESPWVKQHTVSQPQPDTPQPLPLQDLEMFDNPLYASFVPKPKLNLRKDLEVPRGARKEVPPIPDQTGTSKYVETPGTKPGSRQLLPPVPQPRMRSFTCSEMKNPVSGKTHVKQSYHAFMEDNPRLGVNLLIPSHLKQPMSTPKSELEHPSSLSNQGQTVKPPLPAKSKQVLELQHSQKDYRETTELPNKTKHPSTENAAQRSSVS